MRDRRIPAVPTWLLWLAILPASVSGGQGVQIDPWGSLEREIAARGLDPGSIEIPGRLTDEMKVWVHSKIPETASREEALRRLLWVLIDPEGLKLAYDASFTGTASEVWSSRKANCLGFTHLFVGLARELGIPTYYVRWALVQNYRKEGDLILVSGHISAGFGTANQRQVLEFGAVDGLEAHLASPISDLEAAARHYANRGAEWLQSGELVKAMAAAEIAVQLEPSLPEGWVNLGVARRRSGDLEGAMEAYQAATVADPDHLPTYQNLGVLMQLRGEEEVAREILALLDRRDNRNPYIYLSLGDLSLEAGRRIDADRFYRKASKVGSDLAETRAARGLWALEAGDLKAARRWLKRAQAVDSDADRTQELDRKLSLYGDSTK